MEYQWIQDFLSSPQLPDIISYVLVGIGFISQFFVKRFVKNDNLMTSTQIDTKISKLKSLQSKIEAIDKQRDKDREIWDQERQELLDENKVIKDENKVLKKAIRLCCFNNKELVKNGIANEVAKLLPIDEETEGDESNV